MVVSTLWPVNDIAMALLMIKFYKEVIKKYQKILNKKYL